MSTIESRRQAFKKNLGKPLVVSASPLKKLEAPDEPEPTATDLMKLATRRGPTMEAPWRTGNLPINTRRR